MPILLYIVRKGQNSIVIYCYKLLGKVRTLLKWAYLSKKLMWETGWMDGYPLDCYDYQSAYMRFLATVATGVRRILFFFWRNLFTLKNCAGGIFLCDKSHVCWSTCGANKCMYAFNYSETPFSSVKVLIYFKGGWAMDITLLCAKRQK